MTSLQYEILKKQCGTTYLYVVEDQQLYTIKAKSKRGTIHQCKNRKCKNRVQIINDICKRKLYNPHHEKDEGQEAYFKLKLEIILRNHLIQNLYTNKTIPEILLENDIPKIPKWEHILYRLRNKLTPKMFTRKNYVKSTDKTKSAKLNNKIHNQWNYITITNNKNHEKNMIKTSQKQLRSTNSALQSTRNVSNSIDYNEQRSNNENSQTTHSNNFIYDQSSQSSSSIENNSECFHLNDPSITNSPKTVAHSKNDNKKTSDNTIWTCSIIPNNKKSEFNSTFDMIQNTSSVTNSKQNFDQWSNTCSMSTDESTQNTTTSVHSDYEIVNKKLNQMEENTSDNTFWTCSIVTNKNKQNELSSTSSIEQNTMDIINTNNNFDQCSDICSIPPDENNTKTDPLLDHDIINDQDSNGSCIGVYNTNESLENCQIEVILIKYHKTIDNCKK